MKLEKIVFTIIGAVMAIAGLGGVPIYAVKGDVLRFAVYTALLVGGIVVLGYAAKD